MPKNEKEAYDKVRDEQEVDSVFDFLYHDPRRVGSFLSQFDAAGHLQQIKQSDASEQRKSDKSAASGSAALPALLKGQLAVEEEYSEKAGESAERIYDPLWTNVRTLLDYLQERNLIQRDINRARIGQFVLAKGDLTVLDFNILKKAWELGSIKKIINLPAENQGNRHERRKNSKSNKPESVDQIHQNFGLELITILPHAVQACFQGAGFSIWCSLKEDCLVVSSSDLFLKHGVFVPGEWNVVGILDAFPDGATSDPKSQLQPPSADDLNTNSGDVPPPNLGGALGYLVRSIAPAARALLGRPLDAYGVTPLMIFREVSG